MLVYQRVGVLLLVFAQPGQAPIGALQGFGSEEGGHLVALRRSLVDIVQATEAIRPWKKHEKTAQKGSNPQIDQIAWRLSASTSYVLKSKGIAPKFRALVWHSTLG